MAIQIHFKFSQAGGDLSLPAGGGEKIDEFQIRTIVIHHSSFVFRLLKQFCGHPARRI
jgi:hypothetical protein